MPDQAPHMASLPREKLELLENVKRNLETMTIWDILQRMKDSEEQAYKFSQVVDERERTIERLRDSLRDAAAETARVNERLDELRTALADAQTVERRLRRLEARMLGFPASEED